MHNTYRSLGDAEGEGDDGASNYNNKQQQKKKKKKKAQHAEDEL